MKIAISSTGKSLESEVDARFGRCPYLLIVEIENNKIKKSKVVENTAMMQGGGAGITAAQIVGNENVDAVIGVNFGPRAFGVLQELGIEIYQGIQGDIKENVQQFIDGKLSKLGGATGPMGMESKSGIDMEANKGTELDRGISRKKDLTEDKQKLTDKNLKKNKMVYANEIKNILKKAMHPELERGLINLAMIRKVTMEDTKVIVILVVPFLHVPIKKDLIKIVEDIIKKNKGIKAEVIVKEMNEKEKKIFGTMVKKIRG